jgi:hypothetical protein
MSENILNTLPQYSKVVLTYDGTSYVGTVIQTDEQTSVYVPGHTGIKVLNAESVEIKEVIGVNAPLTEKKLQALLIGLLEDADSLIGTYDDVASTLLPRIQPSKLPYAFVQGRCFSSEVEKPIEWVSRGRIVAAGGKSYSVYLSEDKDKMKLVDDYGEQLIMGPEELVEVIKYN